MSNTSEPSQTGNPLDALESLYAQPRRAAERPEAPRLAAVNELAALARAPRPEPSPRPVVPLNERIEGFLPESARRRIEPEIVPEPDDFKSEGLRRKLVAGVIGFAAAVAVASVVALLLVNIFPKDKDTDQSVTAATPPPQSRQVDADSNPPASQVPEPVIATDGGQNLNHEQSEQLLQQFMEWRQKAASTDKP